MNFLPTAAIFAQFAIATFIIALTPGPDMTLFVGRALAEGRAAGLRAWPVRCAVSSSTQGWWRSGCRR